MIKKQLKKASDKMSIDNLNTVPVEGTPFFLTKIDNEKFAVTASNMIIAEGKLKDLSDKFNENLFSTLFWFIETVVDLKLKVIKNKEVNNEQ